MGKRKAKLKRLRRELDAIAEDFETRIDGALSRAMTIEALLGRIATPATMTTPEQMPPVKTPPLPAPPAIDPPPAR